MRGQKFYTKNMNSRTSSDNNVVQSTEDDVAYTFFLRMPQQGKTSLTVVRALCLFLHLVKKYNKRHFLCTLVYVKEIKDTDTCPWVVWWSARHPFVHRSTR